MIEKLIKATTVFYDFLYVRQRSVSTLSLTILIAYFFLVLIYGNNIPFADDYGIVLGHF